METRGTPLYRRTVAVEVVGQVLRTLAEGVSLQGTARLCGVGSCLVQLRLIARRDKRWHNTATSVLGREGWTPLGSIFGARPDRAHLGRVISEIWSHGVELKRFEQRWARFVARQQRQQARRVSQGLPGLGHRPDCADCQAKASATRSQLVRRCGLSRNEDADERSSRPGNSARMSRVSTMAGRAWAI